MFVVRHKENARQTIYLPCAKIKTHGKLFFYRAFFCRAPWKTRTAKLLFAVRPKMCARQRLKRTAIIVFPVVGTS
jgi:hypothetical protein